jgi:hypothetical protein
MHLSQMLLQVIFPCKSIHARPVTSCKMAAIAFDARVRLLVTTELEYSFVMAGAPADST